MSGGVRLSGRIGIPRWVVRWGCELVHADVLGFPDFEMFVREWGDLEHRCAYLGDEFARLDRLLASGPMRWG